MTQRERQILRLIELDPMISQETLAQKLGITRSSVAVHISNLTKKGCIAGRGYVLRTGEYVVVVGGANVDICGRSWETLVPEDSNPGLVSMSIGGVGRNIAHNLSLMGADVRMLTAVGDDLNGQRLCAASAAAGIDMSRILKLTGLCDVAGGRASTHTEHVQDVLSEEPGACGDSGCDQHRHDDVFHHHRAGFLTENAAQDTAEEGFLGTGDDTEGFLVLVHGFLLFLFC